MVGATAGQTIGISTLVSITDPDSVSFQKLELWDSNGTSANGQFVVHGAPQTGGHEIDVVQADVANTVFNVGITGATDTLWARLLQDNGTLTAWQQFTVKDPITIAAGATVEISSAYAGAVSFATGTGTLRAHPSPFTRRWPRLRPGKGCWPPPAAERPGQTTICPRAPQECRGSSRPAAMARSDSQRAGRRPL